MKTETGKKIAAVGIIGLLGYGAYRLTRGPKEVLPPGTFVPSGEMFLTIIPAGMGALPYLGAITPATLQEGSTGNIAVLTITNTSVYIGSVTLAPYTFTVFINIYGAANPNATPPTSWAIPILVNRSQLQLGASASGTVSKTFDIPLGVYGVKALVASAQLQTTDGNTALADSLALKLDVVGKGIIPGGTINW